MISLVISCHLLSKSDSIRTKVTMPGRPNLYKYAVAVDKTLFITLQKKMIIMSERREIHELGKPNPAALSNTNTKSLYTSSM